MPFVHLRGRERSEKRQKIVDFFLHCRSLLHHSDIAHGDGRRVEYHLVFNLGWPEHAVKGRKNIASTSALNLPSPSVPLYGAGVNDRKQNISSRVFSGKRQKTFSTVFPKTAEKKTFLFCRSRLRHHTIVVSNTDLL